MGSVSVTSDTAFRHPPEAIYDFVSDPENWTKAYPGSHGISGVDRLPLEVGDVWHEGGTETRWSWRLITAVRPKKFVFQSVGRLNHQAADPENTGFEGIDTITYEFLTPGEGVTVFRRTMTLELPKGDHLPDGLIRIFEPHNIDDYHAGIKRALGEPDA